MRHDDGSFKEEEKRDVAQGAANERARPRSVPVVVLFWDGKEVNVLTSSQGLPAPPIVARTARELVLSRSLRSSRQQAGGRSREGSAPYRDPAPVLRARGGGRMERGAGPAAAPARIPMRGHPMVKRLTL